MAPHEGLVHLKEYDIEDSNVELIGTDIDHQVKYNSAATEPAWNDGRVGKQPGILVWRIEDFTVVPQPADKRGEFYDGDSYIVLHSWTIKDDKNDDDAAERLGHEIFFWLGSKTSQDEAGTAAYKTVELDEFLGGAATQRRELQKAPSDDFLALFPRLTIRSGGVASGFRHVEAGETSAEREREGIRTLLRVFRPAGQGAVVVYEVEPTWESLDEGDVFVLDVGNKIWVWQGGKCSPMEKAKAAQVVHDMTQAKHVDVEVVSQTESRSWVVVRMLGGGEDGDRPTLSRARPVVASSRWQQEHKRPRRLFRLTDESGELTFQAVKEGSSISSGDLNGDDVFLLDDEGKTIWVWVGSGASKAERALWLKVAQSYVRRVQADGEASEAYLTPIAQVHQGHETASFRKAIAV
ncbi:probable actin regulatory proteins (gelsolin/villin family) [Cephalotrichum gorgonifer]|uniref:Probable actin regulatory proteins (Gelsolin/villin family) n=1 Tax=Cephalotrichum gorgonifer TaxID=2041049 RepID=A0AAE8N3J9_9PEZI|nr:probable actin regulatory proteins (gelsolin/villin family) [Cephalotrichum gorgonifer]